VSSVALLLIVGVLWTMLWENTKSARLGSVPDVPHATTWALPLDDHPGGVLHARVEHASAAPRRFAILATFRHGSLSND
jgi:hypothetical protein